MRHQLTAERRDRLASDTTEAPEEWIELGTVLASIETTGGTESSQASGVGGVATHKLRFRWGPTLADLKPADRFDWNGRKLEVGAVNNENGRNRWVTCETTEAV